MQNSWIVLFPPIAVLSVAIITRNVIWSLLTGIVSAALIATNFSPLQAITTIATKAFEETDIPKIFRGESPDHLYTFIFLITLGIIISLITHTGGMHAYSRTLSTRIKDKKAAESSSLLLSLFFFIDDYLSSLTVGSIMRPVTDRFLIPRAKLAFLLDAMSAPLCVLIPASSWVAFILTQLEAGGISLHKNGIQYIQADGFYIYLKSILYMFYPILLVLSAWFIVYRRISFGSMHIQEVEADTTGNLFGGKEPPTTKLSHDTQKEGSLVDFILPIGTFLTLLIIVLLYSGSWHFFGGSASFLTSLQSANSLMSLFLASIITLPLSVVYFMLKGKLSLQELKEVSIEGFYLMKNSLIVLLLAWTFSNILKNDLGTGKYLAELLLGTLPGSLMPVMVFITALLVAASTGSAWGTIAIIIPLAIPMVVAFTHKVVPLSVPEVPLLFPVLGAVISGAIAGGHVSPISDSTVMSSTSSGCYHIDHIMTQIGYVAPVILGTSAAFLITGLFASYTNSIVSISIQIGLGITCIIFLLRNRKH
jgi:tetracycline resistance efflux pump